jgi:hypothetical protein
MQTTLRTIRIQSGLYISVDGNWKIQRAKQYLTRGKTWTVYRNSDMHWMEVKRFKSLAAARMFVTENVQSWWG